MPERFGIAVLVRNKRTMKHEILALAVAAGFVSSVARAESPEAPTNNQSQRVLSTADQPVPKSFVIYENREIGAFIKPVLQTSASVVGYIPDRDNDEDQLSGRTSTLLLARFGMEGRINDWIHFRSVFERNVGYSLARNGPVGTSVWEGTGSFQARENYIRLQRWGFSLTGGIVPDPASIDFVADATLDLFGMDPYVRDPLLVSGFNQGQGFLFRYNRWGFTAGISVTAGNPLVSSLAFGFGGNVSSLGTLFSAPLRALANGIPGSDIHMVVFSPSLMFESDIVDIKLAGQFYDVNVDLNNNETADLTGFNLRSTAQVKFWGQRARVFGSFAYRKNQQLDIPDLTTRLDSDFEGLVAAAGAEVNIDDVSIGGQWYWVRTEATDGASIIINYGNFGAMYWLWERSVSVGLRWGFNDVDPEAEGVAGLKTHTFIGALRLLI